MSCAACHRYAFFIKQRMNNALLRVKKLIWLLIRIKHESSKNKVTFADTEKGTMLSRTRLRMISVRIVE